VKIGSVLLPYFIVVLLAVMINDGVPEPVPVSRTVYVGFPGAVVVMTRFADSSTVRVGVNVTPIVQFEAAAAVPFGPAPHELPVTAKSGAFVPVIDRA